MKPLYLATTYRLSFFVLLCSTIPACDGSSSINLIPGNSTSLPSAQATIASVQASYAALPMPDTAAGMTGKVTYFCDCGTGPSGSCVAGNDSTGAGTAASPYQTIAKAMSTLNSASTGATVALCNGGTFNETGALSYTNTSCTPGAAGSPKYCFDFREYSSPNFTSSAKPIINQSSGANALVIQSNNGGGGLRIMNLDFEGNATAAGLFLYAGNGTHTAKSDILFANNDINGFTIGIQDAEATTTPYVNQNVSAIGNNFTNNKNDAWLGSSNYSNINYNYMYGNGSDTSLDHSIYLDGETPVTNFTIKGNYIWNPSVATCSGTIIVVHGQKLYTDIESNYIGEDSSHYNNGCWGIGVIEGAYGTPEYFRNTSIIGNTIVNGGTAPIALAESTDSIIANNTIINLTSGGGIGISVPAETYVASEGDDQNNATTVVNNTIYNGSAITSSRIGISDPVNEGTGYVFANNSIYNAATTGSGANCFSIALPTSSFTYMDDNNCYSASGSYVWEVNHGSTLAVWRSYSGFDLSSSYADPLFTAPTATPPSFIPNTGSPLIGAGNHTYAPLTDALGVTRPDLPAIGAFEP